jgi:hypothetical protein
MSKSIIRFNKELFDKYSAEHSLKLVDENDINKIHCNIYLTGNCVTEGCNETFTKKFHVLYKSNIYTCKQCTIKNGVINNKKTCMEKYGVESVWQVKEVRDKVKSTVLEKYGVDVVSKCESIKEKLSEKIKLIRKENPHPNLKYNNDNRPINHISNKKERERRIIEKYGQLNYRSSPVFKELVKKGIQNKHGVEHISKVESVIENKKINNIKKYGVASTSQVPEIANKITKNGFKLKEFIFPSGKIEKVQGYEPFALRDLIEKENICENDIITGCKNVPTIWYNDINQVKRRHFVDIFIPSQNKCIEIKSSFTVKKDNVFEKQKTAKNLGYLYEIWVYNEKGEIIEKHI